jgi:hypothetical protein
MVVGLENPQGRGGGEGEGREEEGTKIGVK